MNSSSSVEKDLLQQYPDFYVKKHNQLILTRRGEEKENVCTVPSGRRSMRTGNVTCPTAFVLKTSIHALMDSKESQAH